MTAITLDLKGCRKAFADGTVAVHDLNLTVEGGETLAILGPSGCGKTTTLRLIAGLERPDVGQVFFGDQDVTRLPIERRDVGMVFQKPNPFPKTIYENVVYGLRIQGINKKRILDEAVEWALKGAALWDEVKDRLHDSALGLSGGQQQRLVIARTIAVEPEVLLLDEPCSALDPISTLKVEELIYELKSKFTIVIVTHNMQQAARVSDYTAFMYMGKLVEFGDTDTLFTNPTKKQ
ncbi:ATP-binding cassette domain-containing protein, partial [Corynebacterium propinquum]